MTVQRMLLFAILGMMLTAGVVYALTAPASPPQLEPVTLQAIPDSDTPEPPIAPSVRAVLFTQPPQGKDAWSGAPEVPLAGGAGLGCKAQMVREWLRILCTGSDVPRTIVLRQAELTRGSDEKHQAWKIERGEVVYTAVLEQQRLASLVARFVEGTAFVALFAWQDKSRELEVRWPRGGTEPTVKGLFRADPLGGR